MTHASSSWSRTCLCVWGEKKKRNRGAMKECLDEYKEEEERGCRSTSLLSDQYRNSGASCRSCRGFLLLISSFPFTLLSPCVTKATETTSSGVNIQRSEKRKERKCFFFFLVFWRIYVSIAIWRRCLQGPQVPTFTSLTLVGGQHSKIPPKNVLKKKEEDVPPSRTRQCADARKF